MTSVVVSALIITLAVEVPIVALLYPRERERMALACALATSATNLLMNAWLLGTGSYDARLMGGEIGATFSEAIVYLVVSRGHEPGKALMASGLANAASFAAGLLFY